MTNQFCLQYDNRGGKISSQPLRREICSGLLGCWGVERCQKILQFATNKIWDPTICSKKSRVAYLNIYKIIQGCLTVSLKLFLVIYDLASIHIICILKDFCVSKPYGDFFWSLKRCFSILPKTFPSFFLLLFFKRKRRMPPLAR